ncbi:MAG: glutathione S-transferase family protein [Gammaproteobacteria bacterium]|nr:glutathione S-transferase family protein [Gammaproteobacteria bacterium]
MKPVLYHHGMSVCAAKVRMAFAEKGIDWEGRYVDIRAGESHTPEYLSLNPKGVVPTLIHDDTVIVESTVICEYIQDAFDGPDLAPTDAASRAWMRNWTKRIDEGLHFPATAALTFVIAGRPGLPKAVERFTPGMAMATDPEPTAPGRLRDLLEATGISASTLRAALRTFDKAIADMEAALKGQPWLAGETFSLADISFAPYVTRLDCLQLGWLWDHRPAVADWYQRMGSRPSHKLAITDWFDPIEEIEAMKRNGHETGPVLRALLGNRETPPS